MQTHRSFTFYLAFEIKWDKAGKRKRIGTRSSLQRKTTNRFQKLQVHFSRAAPLCTACTECAAGTICTVQYVQYVQIVQYVHHVQYVQYVNMYFVPRMHPHASICIRMHSHVSVMPEYAPIRLHATPLGIKASIINTHVNRK